METGYINGAYLPREDIKISPDDRGFLFADGIYEVVRWYEGEFFDMEGHLQRLKRSLRELEISWPEADSFPAICRKLISVNGLEKSPVLVYIQVTRGAAMRTHTFPSPAVPPTVYAFARSFVPESSGKENGITVMLRDDFRWSRCDIKSVALLANTISFEEATRKGFSECIYTRNGKITEGSHSNIFFVKNNILLTHPESEYVLSGITRKNALAIARNLGIAVKEEAMDEKDLARTDEAFITNTSAEVTPVVAVGTIKIGDGKPGPVTCRIRESFTALTARLKH
ncbi:MAG TPA: aminotransferase class IV [Bacteroidales bacterium]|nr:aminotransferase class IV [Bacteroidales bacterium]